MYIQNPYYYQRRKTHEVKIGDVGVGGNNPIRVQSMTIADTLNTDAVVAEIKGLVDVGCEIVRVTAPTIKHAENLKNIRDGIRKLGLNVPLVADIHFTPNAAEIAANYVEKVRINPGNYVDRKLFVERDYTHLEYDDELARVADKFLPLVRKCKTNGVAMRVGTNHGSLSDRIMNRFGDTPLGMVESALEFLRLCESENYREVILSMKASNTQVMVAAYRLLVARLYELNWTYPLHLGVTEAGDGLDGRIKSAIGIMSLLEDGIGDTIRVSLTEDSIHEIPVAYALVKPFNKLQAQRDNNNVIQSVSEGPSIRKNYFLNCQLPLSYDPYHYTRRVAATRSVGPIYIGGKHSTRVEQQIAWDVISGEQAQQIFFKQIAALVEKERIPEIVSILMSGDIDVDAFQKFRDQFKLKFPQLALSADLQDQAEAFAHLIPLVDKIAIAPNRYLNVTGWMSQAQELLRIAKQWPTILEWKLCESYLPAFANERIASECLIDLAKLSERENYLHAMLCWAGDNILSNNRYLVNRLAVEKIYYPLHLTALAKMKVEPANAYMYVAGELGALLLDGLGDLVSVTGMNLESSVVLVYDILQGCRVRISKTEFIACPSCGRTQFDLQTTTQRVKANTSHLKDVKIAIMGCIVNGPGEMADADFGYVGGGPGRIHLYVGKECVEKNLPSEIAVEKLIALIKSHDKWVEPKEQNYATQSVSHPNPA